MSGSLLVSDGTAGIFPVSFGLYPQEGSRAISVEYDWTSTAAYAEDMSQAEAYGLATTIQAAFIDNSGNAQPVTLIAGGTGQSVTIPGFSQGIVPLLLTGGTGYTISVAAPMAQVTRVQLLNVPAGINVWSSRGIIDLNLMGPALDPLVTFNRSSSASMFDATGALVTVGNDVPRFDHDPVSLQPIGLMMEEQRTNLLLNTTAPLVTQSPTTAAANYVLSFYDTGSITFSGSAAGTLTGTGPFPQRVQVLIAAAAGPLLCTVTGSVLNAQLELVPNVPIPGNASSWISTAGAPVTRAFDIASVATAQLAGLGFHDGPGTLFAQGMLQNSPGNTNNGFAALTNGVTQQQGPQIWEQNNSTGLFTSVYGGGGGLHSNPLSRPALLPPGVNKAAVSWAADLSVNQAINGVIPGGNPTAVAALPAGMNVLWLGRINQAGTLWSLNGWLQHVTYWPRAMTASQLLALVS